VVVIDADFTGFDCVWMESGIHFLTWLLKPPCLPMSQAFMKESDDQSLTDISPTLSSLVLFLTRENNGIRVYEKANVKEADGRQVHRMSNGLSYAKNREGRWQVV